MSLHNDTTDLSHFDQSFDDFSISLQEYIKNIIKQEGYVKHRLEKKIIPQDGNFLSYLYELDIVGETADGKKETSLFIKKAVKLGKIKLLKVCDVYSKELFFYNELSRIFLSLQDAANVPNAEKFRFLKTYDSNNEAIIMENISKKGFKMYNGTQVIPIRFAELSIIELAKYHAFSYILKKKIPKYFDSKIKILKHPFQLDSDWEGFLNNVCAVAAEVVRGEAKAKIKSNTMRILQTYQKYTKDTVPVNGCLCHGDYKLQNILVKEVNGAASEVIGIDYQLVYYGNPVDDFLFFIFSGTDQDFRRKHLNYLKNLYYDKFANFLSYFDVDVNLAYSRQEFENDYEERLGLGLVFGLYMSAYMFAHVEEGFDLTKSSLSELPIIPDELFADRVRGIVADYIEWGYL